MKRRWLTLFLLLGGALLLVTGCGARVTDTPAPPLIPVETAAPVVPTAGTTAAPTPDLAARPEMTILGNLASGIPHGVTSEGHYFKGDPQAPVLIIEFSDYQ